MSAGYAGRPGLIAPESETKSYEGAGILESVSGMVDNAFTGEWFSFAGNFGASALGAVGAVMDPLQTAFAAGAGWLMEHWSFLREPLDVLLGDPKAIEGHAQSWKNIEQRTYDATAFFAAEVNATTAAWSAESATAYRRLALDHAQTVQAMGKVADGMSQATTVLGALVGVARNTIRDILAQFAGAVISKALQAATGVLMAKAITDISLLAFDISRKVFDVVEHLITQIKKVGLLVEKLQGFLNQVRKNQDKVLLLVSHRLEAANLADQGWNKWGKAYKVLTKGDISVYGPARQVIINTGRAGAQSNSSQNGGSATDKSLESPEPAPIDIPL